MDRVLALQSQSRNPLNSALKESYPVSQQGGTSSQASKSRDPIPGTSVFRQDIFGQMKSASQNTPSSDSQAALPLQSLPNKAPAAIREPGLVLYRISFKGVAPPVTIPAKLQDSLRNHPVLGPLMLDKHTPTTMVPKPAPRILEPLTRPEPPTFLAGQTFALTEAAVAHPKDFVTYKTEATLDEMVLDRIVLREDDINEAAEPSVIADNELVEESEKLSEDPYDDEIHFAAVTMILINQRGLDEERLNERLKEQESATGMRTAIAPSRRSEQRTRESGRSGDYDEEPSELHVLCYLRPGSRESDHSYAHAAGQTGLITTGEDDPGYQGHEVNNTGRSQRSSDSTIEDPGSPRSSGSTIEDPDHLGENEMPKNSKNQPYYNGPPAYLYPEGRTDPYADPKYVVQDPDGTNRPIHSVGNKATNSLLQPAPMRTLVGAVKPVAEKPKATTSQKTLPIPIPVSRDCSPPQTNTSDKVAKNPELPPTPLSMATLDLESMETIEQPEERKKTVSPPSKELQNHQDYVSKTRVREGEQEIIVLDSIETADPPREETTSPPQVEPQNGQDSVAKTRSLEGEPMRQLGKQKIVRYDEFAPPPQYTPTASQFSSIRSTANMRNHRKRSISAVDDYPVPDIDDMRILPEKNSYTRKLSGKRTLKTPTEHERVYAIEIKVQQDEVARQRAEFRQVQEARRKRDEEEMYHGLSNYKGRQRGWNGERESDRQKTIREHHEKEDRQHQAQLNRRRKAAEISQPPKEDVSLEDLEAGMRGWRDRMEIEKIVLEDEANAHMQDVMHKLGNKKNDNIDQVMRDVHLARKGITPEMTAQFLKQYGVKTHGSKGSVSRSLGGTSMDIQSPTSSPNRHQSSRIGSSNGEQNHLPPDEDPSPKSPAKRRRISPESKSNPAPMIDPPTRLDLTGKQPKSFSEGMGPIELE